MEICKHCNILYHNRKTDHYRCCEQYKTFIQHCKDKCTKEFLEEEYLVNMKSIMTIKAELGLEKSRLILAKLKEHNIPQRTIQEATANPTRQELTRKKSREKYGVEHHLMNRDVIQKREATNQTVYGSCNVFQNDEIKKKSRKSCLDRFGVEHASSNEDIKQKIKQTNLKKYGVEYVAQYPAFIKKGIDTKFRNDTLMKFFSKSSQQLFWKLYNNLPKELQEKCYFAELNKEFSKYKNRPYMFDFVISSINYCLEYNGNYYHANPKLYESDWVNQKLSMTAQEIWDKDIIKQKIIKDFGFHLDIVWEDEDIDEAVTRLTTSILSIQKTHKAIPNETDHQSVQQFHH